MRVDIKRFLVPRIGLNPAPCGDISRNPGELIIDDFIGMTPEDIENNYSLRGFRFGVPPSFFPLFSISETLL